MVVILFWYIKYLMIFSGSQERLKSFPPLEGIELQVDGRSSYESSCDVVLSSAGWISCAPRCQFHQHFMHAFFVRKCLSKLFSNYCLNWNYFFQKNIGEKAACEMLMKFTTEWQTSSRWKPGPRTAGESSFASPRSFPTPYNFGVRRSRVPRPSKIISFSFRTMQNKFVKILS